MGGRDGERVRGEFEEFVERLLRDGKVSGEVTLLPAPKSETLAGVSMIAESSVRSEILN